MPKPKHPTQEQVDARYWRYKKRSVPIDEFAHLNGPVITTIPRLEPDTTQGTLTTPTYAEPTAPKHGMVSTLPHHLKCSKCAYVATSKQDFNNHWLDEH